MCVPLSIFVGSMHAFLSLYLLPTTDNSQYGHTSSVMFRELTSIYRRSAARHRSDLSSKHIITSAVGRVFAVRILACLLIVHAAFLRSRHGFSGTPMRVSSHVLLLLTMVSREGRKSSRVTL